MNNWKERFRASGIHLGISLAIAGLAALLVFFVWYPYPYREISGGRGLFLLVVTVDVILGPLITFAICSRNKSRNALMLDFVVIGALQAAALVYGLWTVALARPVYLVFEFDRFRVVHAVEVDPEKLHLAPKNLQSLPWAGPVVLGLRPFHSEEEKVNATLAALAGGALSASPALWQDYSASARNVLEVARPASQLKQRFPAHAALIDATLQSVGRSADAALSVPVAGRKDFWTAFVDPATANVLAFIPLDSF